ncbi:MAG TPA: EamA family transporter RarD [Rhizomicrobium sp.]|nr:EamA family transporter RarD [Rhizomicrobium sp.]
MKPRSAIALEDREIASADAGAPVDVDAPDSPSPSARDDASGILLAGFAYAFWGVMPVYWRLLASVPPFELTVHRIFWCALFLAIVALARRRLPQLMAIARAPRLLGTLALTSVLITCNWTLYIYCVATHQLVEASLGYYINPLISIALGVALFGEKMSRPRLAAVVLAGVAVAVKAVGLGHFPWIAPCLALSFGFYGYFRKLTPVDSTDGLTVETWILFPITCGLVLFWRAQGTGAFPAPDLTKDALLIFGGPLTAVPLAMFSAGARRIRLSTLGFLQYLSPSITLVLATFGFGEAFTRTDAVTFGIVWLALAFVAAEGRIGRRLMRPRAAPR